MYMYHCAAVDVVIHVHVHVCIHDCIKFKGKMYIHVHGMAHVQLTGSD